MIKFNFSIGNRLEKLFGKVVDLFFEEYNLYYINKINSTLLKGKILSIEQILTISPKETRNIAIYVLQTRYEINHLQLLDMSFVSDKLSELLLNVSPVTSYKYLSMECEYNFIPPRVFDAFTYNDESNLLSMRLNLLNNYVDYFIVVESDMTFTGVKKSLVFKIDNYLIYQDNIIYIPVTDMPFPNSIDSGLAWRNEYFQRDSLLSGLYSAKKTDIVIISDVDEIPKIENKDHFIDSISNNKHASLASFHFHFFLDNIRCDKQDNYNNCTAPSCWTKARSVIFQFMNEQNMYMPNDIRDDIDGEMNPFSWKDVGWHFSYVLSKDKILEKFMSFSHTEIRQNIENSDLFSSNKIMDEIMNKICTGQNDLFGQKENFAFLFSENLMYTKVDIDYDIHNDIYTNELSKYISDNQGTLENLLLINVCEDLALNYN